MQALAQQNDNFKYILMMIDVFSKFGWAVPLKFKSRESVRTALEAIFSQHTPKNCGLITETSFTILKCKDY